MKSQENSRDCRLWQRPPGAPSGRWVPLVHSTALSSKVELFNKFFSRFILNLLDTSKVLGVDNLPDRIIRACVKELSIPLAHLFNSSLRSDVMPRLWRFANINFVHKGGNREVVDNYRSISLQPLLLSTWSV